MFQRYRCKYITNNHTIRHSRSILFIGTYFLFLGHLQRGTIYEFPRLVLGAKSWVPLVGRMQILFDNIKDFSYCPPNLMMMMTYSEGVDVVLAGDDDETFGRVHDAVVGDVGDRPRRLQGLLVLKQQTRRLSH